MPGIKTIYARDGTAIADIDAAVTRSSLLNEIGEAVFLIPVDNAKCREDVLRYGNYLYVQNDTLADWVGMIDTPRSWKNGYVECHAFDPMFLLQYRLAPLNATITGTPGEKFTQLIAYANAKEDTLLRVGYVSAEGVSGDKVLTDTIYTELKNLAAETNHEWICTPSINTDGTLSIIVDWFAAGGNATDLELAQGYNIQYGDTPLEEAGELVNSVEGVSTVESEDGSTQIVTSYMQAAPYGLREVRVSFDGVTNSDTLLKNCTEMVKAKVEATFGAPITAVNIGNTFRYIRLRNVVTYKYTNVGFSASGLGYAQQVRIAGYLFNEATGTCEIYTDRILNT
jgi:hypothetical protein